VQRPRLSRLAGRTVLAAVLVVLVVLGFGSTRGDALPTGFQEEVVFSGLTNPTQIRFAPDGRVFVAEKSGLIKVFTNLTDTTPTVFADLRTNVHNFWDRGLLGMALHPSFPTQPYVYVLYTYDAAIGGTAPRWGTAGATSDPCPTPPGPTGDGCVVSGRLSRLQAAGDVMTGSEQVLIEDWCQQYPSHSIGSLAFGADGALYVTGGDGASFNFTDWGQDGSPVNPCGDPPGGVGAALTPPTAEGGALRSQDLRTSGDPVSLDGAVLRVDPTTGAGLPTNPLAGSSDPNARRIIAHGLRNPFRFAIRPGTSEVWVGDVGWNTWEEINRVVNPTDAVVENFGWPCYEGTDRQSGYDGANLTICENLYAQAGAVTSPFFTYNHSAQIVPGEACPTGSSSIAGVAFEFYSGGPYPTAYDGALFFADYSRDCVWAMFRGGNNLPNPGSVINFVMPAANPVDLQISPAGELFYADFDGGTIRRIRYFSGNQPPTAIASANPESGTAPLTVSFSALSSSDPEGQTLSYAWDLDGDGAYDDSTSATPSRTYGPGTVTVGLRVTDSQGASDTDTVVISADNTPPTATITAPSASTTWRVGSVISFSGSATDAQDGPLAPARLSWSLILHHCPSNCHTHAVQTFPGVASGSFTAPDHEYPSHLELRLTATDSGGLTNTKSVLLNPQTVNLTFQSSPTGLQLVVGPTAQTTPFTRTVIIGSSNSVSATSPQTLGGTTYAFSSWSDGGAQTHTIVAPATAATYTATYAPTGSACPTGQYRAEYFANRTLTGSPTFTRCETTINNNWGAGGPGGGVGPDNFSVRWSGTFNLSAGTHLFEVRADDGIRLWIDSALAIDQWRDQSPTRYRVSRNLTAGAHTVRVEYYENAGGAVAELTRNACAAGQFVGQYYNNRTLANAPAFTRCDAAIAFNWGTGSPGTGVGVDNFSVRWTGRPTFAAGTFRFTARADDGVRVWIDGVLLIDAWRDQAPTTYSATRTLTAGNHEVRMEYYENGGGAVAALSWAPA
jgi:glucose/arabinose dehydrogenase